MEDLKWRGARNLLRTRPQATSRFYTEAGRVGVTGTPKGRLNKGEEHKLG